MCFVIDTKGGRVGVSDCIFKYGNLEDGEPLGIQESLEEYYKTSARIRSQTDLFIPLYEPEAQDRLQKFNQG